MYRNGAVWFLTLILTAFAIDGARAEPVLNITGGQHDGWSLNETTGWAFTSAAALTVTALDAFDPTGSGFVELYDSTGTILASTTVTKSDPQEGTGIQFYSQSITPVTLAAGKTYFIMQNFAEFTTFGYFDATGLSTSPLIVYDGFQAVEGFNQTPTSYLTTYQYPAAFGPDFDATAAAVAVPEPSSFELAGAGLVFFGVMGRRKGCRLPSQGC